MTRTMSVAAILLAATILGLPWVLGSEAQALHQNALSRLQERGVRVLDSHYRRGWFTSDASVQIELPRSPGQARGAVAVPLRISSQIAHGPWTYRSPRLRPTAALIESHLDFFAPGFEPSRLRLTTRVELDGSGLTLIRVPAVSHQRAVIDLETAEGVGELKFTADFASTEGWFELPSVSLSTPEGVRIDLHDLRVSGAASRWIAGLSEGEGTLTLGRAALSVPDESLLAVGLSASGKATPDGGLMNVELVYRLDDLTVNGAAFGPSQLSFALRRLPGEALASVQQATRELTAGSIDESLAAVAMAAILTEHLPRLLADDPEFAVEGVEIGTPEGVIRGHLSIASKGLTAADMERPGSWLDRLAGEGELSLPRALLLPLLEDWQQQQVLGQLQQQGLDSPNLPEGMDEEIALAAREQLDALIGQGWLAEKEDALSAALRLEDALLTVNGKSIPVGAAAASP